MAIKKVESPKDYHLSKEEENQLLVGLNMPSRIAMTVKYLVKEKQGDDLESYFQSDVFKNHKDILVDTLVQENWIYRYLSLEDKNDTEFLNAYVEGLKTLSKERIEKGKISIVPEEVWLNHPERAKKAIKTIPELIIEMPSKIRMNRDFIEMALQKEPELLSKLNVFTSKGMVSAVADKDLVMIALKNCTIHNNVAGIYNALPKRLSIDEDVLNESVKNVTQLSFLEDVQRNLPEKQAIQFFSKVENIEHVYSNIYMGLLNITKYYSVNFWKILEDDVKQRNQDDIAKFFVSLQNLPFLNETEYRILSDIRIQRKDYYGEQATFERIASYLDLETAQELISLNERDKTSRKKKRNKSNKFGDIEDVDFFADDEINNDDILNENQVNVLQESIQKKKMNAIPVKSKSSKIKRKLN